MAVVNVKKGVGVGNVLGKLQMWRVGVNNKVLIKYFNSGFSETL